MTTSSEQVPSEERRQKIIEVEVRPDGVALVRIDDTSSSVNTITRELGEQLSAALDRVERDDAIVGAVILSGKKDSFVVGANLELLRSITLAADGERLARQLAEELRRIKSMRKPVIAAVHGQALGGGFELALACHAIVASDDPKTQLGLPEVQLGLLPGANGLLRVAERAGLRVALDLGLTGKSTRAVKAKKLSLVDEVCPPSILLDVAVKVAKARAQRVARTEKTRAPGLAESLGRLALEGNPVGRRVLFKKAREATRAKTRGHYPATSRIIDLLERFAASGARAASELEPRLFGELVVSETAHRLGEIFVATTALKKDNGVDDAAVEGRLPARVAVLGGGLMGAGIAYVTIDNAKTPVRLKDKDDAGAGRGLAYARGLLDERATKRQITREERDQTLARLTATADYSGLRQVDLVIEAVFEDLSLKHEVLRATEAVTKESCIFASNTSSIPITKIAEASRRPDKVVGMHYFSPVHKMPLLEVIRTKETAKETTASAVSFGKKQGKTVIVVNDGVGFYTSRILGPYMNEAAWILSEGIAIDAIDEALVAWGWPVGPITLLDEVGIDVAAHVGPIMVSAFGERMAPPATTAKLLADGRNGRKNERGFYRYDKPGKRARRDKRVDLSVYAALGVEPRGRLPAEEIQMRCSLQLVNEALRCFGEGVLRSPRDGDVGAIFGLGFPPFRGGPFRYVDTLGPAEVLRRTQGYFDRFGARWEPAPLLCEMARTNARFYND